MIRWCGGSVIAEVNPYDAAVGTLKGLPADYSPSSPPLNSGETYRDDLVIEMKPTSSLTGETSTFHFALATGRYKDNRIPPQGFRIADAPARLAEPVWHGVSAPSYFTAAEYSNGCDDISLDFVSGADAIEIALYYQTTSREYIEFLRDEILGTGRLTLSSPAPSGEPRAYVIQTDPFFAALRAWGTTIWDLWWHNKDLPGAAPVLMTRASLGLPSDCDAPTPQLLSVVPDDGQISITWTDEHSGDPAVVCYRVYYDQAGKVQRLADICETTAYTDVGLINGQHYCYRVATLYDQNGDLTADCISAVSNVLCSSPNGPVLTETPSPSPVPPTNTPVPPTATPVPPTPTPLPTGGTPVMTETPLPPTATPTCDHSGDVSNNGQITPEDGQLCFLYYIDCQSYHPTREQYCAADFCGSGFIDPCDGSVTPADALGIMKEYTRLPNPCAK